MAQDAEKANAIKGKRDAAPPLGGGRRHKDHRARSQTCAVAPGYAGLLRQVLREARLCSERSSGLFVRRSEAPDLRRDLQRPDARALRPVQARARNDRGRRVLAEPLLLLPGRARRRGARAVRRSGAGRADGDELPRRPVEQAAPRHARLRGEGHDRTRGRSRKTTARRCDAPASPIATSGTSPRSPASTT